MKQRVKVRNAQPVNPPVVEPTSDQIRASLEASCLRQESNCMQRIGDILNEFNCKLVSEVTIGEEGIKPVVKIRSKERR